VPLAPRSFEGITHVAFCVREVAKSREFYRKLGFEQGFEFVDPDKLPVSYVKINDRQFIELCGGADGQPPPGIMHVCYQVKDMELLVRDYADRGLHLPRKARAGNMVLLLHDPEEQIVEFTQYLPGSLHFEDRGKHLGEHQISQRLVEVDSSVRDVAPAAAFYRFELGFKSVALSERSLTLQLPGDSEERIAICDLDCSPSTRIVFESSNISDANEKLHHVGIIVNASGTSHELSDPDGTIIVLEKQR